MTSLVEAPRDVSPGRYTALPIEEALSPSSEILSTDGLRASNASPSSDMSLSSTASCVSPDVIEGSLVDSIFKPDVGAVFVRDYSFLPI